MSETVKVVSIVDDNYAILHKQISDHPNFDLQKIQREVVIEEVKINAKKDSPDRGFLLSYHILHYNKGEIDRSFTKTTNDWFITDDLMIAERDLSTFEPIENAEYVTAAKANKLPSTIKNPNYIKDNPEYIPNPKYIKDNPEYIKNPDFVSAEELAKIDEFIPNPLYVSEEETPDIEPMITNPDYIIASSKNKYNPEYIPNPLYITHNLEFLPNPNYVLDNAEYITNPAYVSNETLARIPRYSTKPAFSYILAAMKSKPYLLFILIEFYLDEQDRDKFFDNYNNG